MNLKKTTKPLFVSLLLDETGSMESIKEPTLRAYNQYLDGLREMQTEAEILFSLVTFNSSRTQVRVISEPVRSVAPLSNQEYQPDAMTPLIDAAVKIIRATDEAVAVRDEETDVVVVIQTDGLENCSVEFDAAHLAQMVKEKQAAGWQFVFLGAGLDAFEAATQAGFDMPRERVMSYDRGQADEMMGVVAAKMAGFYHAREAWAMDFDDADRSRVGDRWHKTAPSGGTRTKPTRDPRKSSMDDFSLLS